MWKNVRIEGTLLFIPANLYSYGTKLVLRFGFKRVKMHFKAKYKRRERGYKQDSTGTVRKSKDRRAKKGKGSKTKGKE